MQVRKQHLIEWSTQWKWGLKEAVALRALNDQVSVPRILGITLKAVRLPGLAGIA